MPLIDESAYNDLKELTGNEASKLDLSMVSTATVARLQVHLDRDSRTMRQLRGMAEGPLHGSAKLGDWIGDWAALWVEDGPRWSAILGSMFGSGTLEGGSVLGHGEDGGPWQLFETPIAVGVAVRNPIALAAFLVAVQGMISSSAPDLVDFVPVDPYHGVRFVQVAPSPRGEVARELLRGRKSSDASSITLPSVHYGTVGSAWYIDDPARRVGTPGGRARCRH